MEFHFLLSVYAGIMKMEVMEGRDECVNFGSVAPRKLRFVEDQMMMTITEMELQEMGNTFWGVSLISRIPR